MSTFSNLLEQLNQASPFLVAGLLDAAIKGTVVLVIAWLVTLLMRKSSAAARHLVWLLAVASLLILPVLSTLLPAWRVLPQWTGLQTNDATPAPLDVAQPAMTFAFDQPVDIAPAPLPDLVIPQATTETHVSEAIATPVTSAPIPVATWMLLGWLIGVAVAALPLLIAAFVLRRIKHTSHPLTHAPWNDLLTAAATELAIRRPVDLRRSDRREMPMTWGIFRPRILLSRDCDAWPAERRRAVLLHELAHVARWDCLWQLIIHLACALFWFHPLAWLARARAQREQERACDDLVLSRGTRGPDYAEQVLHVASDLRTTSLTSAAAIAMARPSQLEGRLMAILDPQRNRKALTWAGIALLVLLLTAVVVPVAVLRAADEEEQQPEAATADPAHGDVATQPAQSVRLIFRPTTTASGKTNWSVLIPMPNEQDPARVFMLVTAYRGDSWPVRVRHAEPPAFHGKLIDGDENQLELEIRDGDDERRLILALDKPQTIEVADREFTLIYGTTMVDGTEPQHVDYATITVTFEGAADAEQQASTKPPGMPPATTLRAAVLKADEQQEPSLSLRGQALRNLSTAYSLKDGEILRLIKPPFPEARAQWLQLGDPSSVSDPDKYRTLFFGWRDSGLISGSGSNTAATLQEIISGGLGIPWYQIEGIDTIAWPRLQGDWVVREIASHEQKLDALVKLIKAETGQTVRVTKRRISLPCVVLHHGTTDPGYPYINSDGRGGFAVFVTAEPLHKEQLAEWSKQLHLWSIMGRPEGFALFSGLSYQIGAPVIEGHTGGQFWRTNLFLVANDVVVWRRADPDHEKKLQRVVDNLQKQLGGEWRIESREVESFTLTLKLAPATRQ